MYGRKWVAVTSGRGAATLLVQVEKKVAAPVATAAWTIGGDGEEQQPRWWRRAREEAQQCWYDWQRGRLAATALGNCEKEVTTEVTMVEEKGEILLCTTTLLQRKVVAVEEGNDVVSIGRGQRSRTCDRGRDWKQLRQQGKKVRRWRDSGGGWRDTGDRSNSRRQQQ
ncbi:hypothetical protein BHM03_00018428 [Ensete ventricosum]|nr:hypothetical protein BHM03_00018428 [Ensete ventricosum]